MSKTYFVSYTAKDSAWAEWVSWIIEDAGYKAILQAWDFSPGSSWSQEMDKAAKNSHGTICILSQEYLESAFCSAEWQAAFVDDPLGDERKILPVRVSECSVEGLLKSRVYVDLVGKTRSESKQLIKSALSGKRKKPENEPKFPGEHGVEPTFPTSNVTYSLVLDGTYSESVKAKVDSIIEHLRKSLDDPSLTVTKIAEGSILLTVNSKFSTYRALWESVTKNLNEKPSIEGMAIEGVWLLEKDNGSPIDNRLEHIRKSLYKFFVDRKLPHMVAEDLSQDVILNLYEAPSRYRYFTSMAQVISLAKIAFSQYLAEGEKDSVRRSGYTNPSGDIDWENVYNASLKVFDDLSDNDRFLIENYWESKFAEHSVGGFVDSAQDVFEAEQRFQGLIHQVSDEN